MTRSLSILAAGLFLSAAPALSAERVPLTGDASYPPYMSEENGARQGIYVDIMREADARIAEYDVDIQLLPWKRALGTVEDGGAAGIVGAYKRTKERPWIERYSIPLLNERVVVLCGKDKVKPNMTYPDDFVGYSFANNSGFETPGPAFFALVKAGRITVEENTSTENNVRKTVLGRVDCHINDEISINKALSNVGGADKVGLAAVVQVESAHLAMGRAFAKPWKMDFMDKVDQAIADMTADGTIQKIVDKHTK